MPQACQARARLLCGGLSDGEKEVFQGKRRIGGGGLATTSPENQNAGRMVVVVRPVITYPIGGGVPKRDWSGNSFGMEIMPKRRWAVQTKSVAKTNTKGPTPVRGLVRGSCSSSEKVLEASFALKGYECEERHVFQALARRLSPQRRILTNRHFFDVHPRALKPHKIGDFQNGGPSQQATPKCRVMEAAAQKSGRRL